jgi:hypothetical protein
MPTEDLLHVFLGVLGCTVVARCESEAAIALIRAPVIMLV